jgi:hypothetical protein
VHQRPPAESYPGRPVSLAVLDWRRQVAALYAAIRGSADPRSAHELWRKTRDVAPDDPAWACPLAPPGNLVDVPVPVGELSELSTR